MIDEKKLIDADKLIEDCKKYLEGRYTFQIPLEYSLAMTRLCEIIEAQPKLSLENKTSDWIPCSDRLPEKHDNYIVTVCDECNLIWAETVVMEADYFEGYWAWYERGDEYDISDMVIAWMPLPPAYKGE